jgi:ubiquinone/menaquinone biosynthesis C-methylase UbiE
LDAQLPKEDIGSEREFFDKFYRERRDRVDPHEPLWISRATHPRSRPLDYWEYTFYLLGDLRGKRALEVGCGGGWMTRMMALKGALVSAIDVSEEGCISTRMKLEKDGLPFETICTMDAHALTFPDNTFDAVLIAGVLHHVNIAKALAEARRVLKPGGKLVCFEPMRYGRFALLLRRLYLQIKGIQEHEHTEHEEALTDAELSPFYELFPKGFIRKFNLLAKTNQLKNRFGLFAESLRWADYILLSVFPPLRSCCTCMVCCFEK